MKLYFLRHGYAGEASGTPQDYERRLTAEGVEEMRRVARGISRVVTKIDLIVSSPLPRALETAHIAAAALGIAAAKVVVSDSLASGASRIEELRDLTKGLPDDHRMMLVGHEPDFSSLVRDLTGAVIEMKKAGVACVDAHGAATGGGVLRWLLTPRHLQLIAGGEE
jgi:phosphohistidine phosphatase